MRIRNFALLFLLAASLVITFPRPAAAEVCSENISEASMDCEDYRDGCEYQVAANCYVIGCSYSGGAYGYCTVSSEDNGATYCSHHNGCYGWVTSCDCGS